MRGTKSWMEIHVMNSIHHVTMSNIGLYDNDNVFNTLWKHVQNFGVNWMKVKYLNTCIKYYNYFFYYLIKLLIDS
jgi:hypothetical protein